MKFISGFSALIFWNVNNLDGVIPSELLNSGVTEYTVTSIREKYRKKGEIIHLYRIPLPEKAVLEYNGKLIASPELAYLQVVNRLNKHERILLAMQMCSYPPGRPNMALTTKERLYRFADMSIGHYGRRNALAALQYVENVSNSIMESHIFMALRLPYHLGGYSFDNIILNHKVELDEESVKKFRQKNCFLDLLLVDYNTAIEYDSYKCHSSSDQKIRDADRDSVISAMGYKVLHLNTYQFFNKNSFDLFISKLLKITGKKLRIRNQEQHMKMQECMRLLMQRGINGYNS